MSSNCPPQLHLTLPANTTSFKRSFEQFGFDLEESPIAGGVESGSSAGNSASGSAGNGSTRIGNERKRARSASSSDGNESLRSSRSSTFTASSDTSFSENNDSLAQSSEPSSSRLVSSITPFVGPRPPRLPTPDIQDVQMPDYEQEEANDSTDNYRFTINEVHQSDHSRSPSHSRRSPTLPPTLPPLSLSEEEQPADMLFMRSSSTPSWSVDRLSRTISVSSSHREDPPMSGFDAPPRLPSPVYDLSPTLSAVIPDSDISSNIDNADNADVVDDEAPPVDAGRYVSFRERLNTAVGLLEADDVSAFRDRLTSALDAVRTDERDIDVEIDSHTLPHNARAPPAQTVPLSSRPWRTASNDMRSDAPAILSPRTRDLVSSSSAGTRFSTSSSNLESGIRPLYPASHSALSRSRPSFSRPVSPSGDTINSFFANENRYNTSERTRASSSLFANSTFEPLSTLRPHQQPSSQSIPSSSSSRRALAQAIVSNRRLASAPISNPFNRELARWFEDPGDSLASSSAPPRSTALILDTDDDWVNIDSRALDARRRARRLRETLPDWAFLPTINRSSSVDPSEEDEDREDEDIIAGLLSSSQERANYDSMISVASNGSSIPSRGARAPPTLASLVARDYLSSDQTNDNDITHSRNLTDSSRTETTRDPSAPRRYADVLSIADYRSQLLADAQRRRYIAQGLVDPRENVESWASSTQEPRRNMPGDGSTFDLDEQPSATSGYRLTAHEMPEAERESPGVRWQFSWNDALGTDETEMREDNDRSVFERENRGAFGRERDNPGRERDNPGRTGNIPRSSLFGRHSRDDFSLGSSHINVQSSGTVRRVTRRSESPVDDHYRLRSRILASTRPSASNSLVVENAVELRRRNARADLMEHLFNDQSNRTSTGPTSRDYSRDTRSSYVGQRESFPNQPSLSYQHRNSSPSDFPRSIADVRDAADRELQEQERRGREEGSDDFPHRSTNLSWLPPPQFGSDRSLSESLAEHPLSPDLDSANPSDGGRNHTIPEIDRLRRQSLAMRRSQYHDDTRSQTHPPTFEIERSMRATPFSRSHVPSSSWSTSRAANEAESSGFFDSRHSSITAMARTISDRSQTPVDPGFGIEPRTGSNDTNNLRRLLRTSSPRNAGHHISPVPSIPPPDLGALFSPRDLPTSSLSSSILMNTDEGIPSTHSDFRYAPTRQTEPFTVHNSIARAPYPSINVDSFAPGPFRSTMQRLAEQNRVRNVAQEAPSIPPLSFGEDLDSFSGGRSYARMGSTEDNRDYSSRESHSSEREPWSVGRPPFVGHRFGDRPRSGEDVHGAITRRPRIDGSVIEGSVPPSSASSSVEGSFQHAIEVLRQDGLSELRSHQLISRYRQRRDAFLTSTSWGDIESNNTSTSNLPHRYAPWSMHGDVSSSNPTISASSTATNTTTRMGNAATRRRPSPARNLDRPDGLPDSRLNRPRSSSRFSRHRTVDLDHEFATLSDLVGRSRRARGNLSLGDYIRDEDFDQSYEGLVSLAATLGEVKPRATPDHVVAGLKTGFYKDWASDDCDKRCPICLDDYKALDPVLKLNACSHWLHKSCLEQWLKGASTCPVCRKSVQTSAPHRHSRLRSHIQHSTASAVTPHVGTNADGTTASPNRSGNPNTGSGSSNVESNSETAIADALRRLGQRPRRFYWEYSPPSP